MRAKVDLVLLLWSLACVSADITVYHTTTRRRLDLDFLDEPARFGLSIPMDGIKTFLVYADPPDACKNLTMAPNNTVPNFTGNWAVLIQRYGCSFEEKVRHAQAANFDIAIIHNVNSSELEPMSINDRTGISIWAVFVGERTGLALKNNYTYDKLYYLLVDDESPFAFNTQFLLPFAIVVGLCFCSMLGFMVVKCYKDYRRARRHRLPYSSLKKIPIAKFRKGDPYETCAICLEDFVEGEKLRVLPCSHAYHCKCVDPWLTRNRRVCPICKRKVFAPDELRFSVTNSDSESDVDDHTPLINASGHTTQGGTFSSSLNAAVIRHIWLRRHSSPEAEGSTAGPSQSTPTIQERASQGDTQVEKSSTSTNPFEDV